MCLALGMELQTRNGCYLHLSLQVSKVDRQDTGRPLFSQATIVTSVEGLLIFYNFPTQKVVHRSAALA